MKKILLGVSFYLLKITLLLVLLTVFAVIAPMTHKTFIRSYVGDKVVKVIHPGKGGGTGFHMKGKSGKTYIITNAHVCLISDKEGYVYIQDINNELYARKKVIKRMKDHDLCAVESLSGVSGLTYADKVYKGETVALVGHPALRPLSLSMGEVIGKTKIGLIFGENLPKKLCIGTTIKVSQIENQMHRLMYALYGVKTLCLAKLDTTMLNAIAYRGNSGSPVVDIFGKVVGVLFAGSPSQPTDSYLVPLPKLKEFLEDL